MKKIVLFVLFLLPLVTFSQYKLKPIPIGLTFIAGASKGVADKLQFHYYEVKEIFPNINDNFWNPDISYKNKWKNGDPMQGEAFWGSSRWFVCFTDGWHGANTTHKTAIIGAICFNIGDRKRPFKYYLYDFVVYSLSYSTGFWITYEIKFK